MSPVDGLCRYCQKRLAGFKTRRPLPLANGKWTTPEPVCKPCAKRLDSLLERLARGIAEVDRAVVGFRGRGAA